MTDAVGPAGLTLVLKFTVPALPLVTAVLMVLVPLDPCVMFKLLGDELIEKSPTGAPQLANLNEAMRVFQLNAPLLGMYSFVYQNVQSSDGSTLMEL